MASYWDWLPVELQERILLVARVQTPPILLEDGLAVLREYGTRRLAQRLRDRTATPRGLDMMHYNLLYSVVFGMCTNKPPYNHTEDLYEFLRDETRRVRHEFPYGSPESEVWMRFHGHVFKYIDRFYIPRLNLPSLRAMMAERLGAPQ